MEKYDKHMENDPHNMSNILTFDLYETLYVMNIHHVLEKWEMVDIKLANCVLCCLLIWLYICSIICQRNKIIWDGISKMVFRLYRLGLYLWALFGIMFEVQRRFYHWSQIWLVQFVPYSSSQRVFDLESNLSNLCYLVKCLQCHME